MRYILLLVCIAISIAKIHAQDSLLYGSFPMVDGRVAYDTIVEVSGKSKEELFTKIKDWAVDSYRSQSATLQSEDKETGYIAYKGYLPTTATYRAGLMKSAKYQVNIHHTLKFYIKDGKFRMIFTDLKTQSLDAASVYLNEGETQTAIETWERDFHKISAKRREKLKKVNALNAAELHSQIMEFINNATGNIVGSPSGFDF